MKLIDLVLDGVVVAVGILLLVLGAGLVVGIGFGGIAGAYGGGSKMTTSQITLSLVLLTAAGLALIAVAHWVNRKKYVMPFILSMAAIVVVAALCEGHTPMGQCLAKGIPVGLLIGGALIGGWTQLHKGLKEFSKDRMRLNQS